MKYAEKSGDSYSLAAAYLCYRISKYYLGEFKESSSFLAKEMVHCERINLLIYSSYAHFFQASNYFHLENYPKALGHFQRAYNLSKDVQSLPSFKNLVKIKIILTKIRNNNLDIDLGSVTAAINSNRG